MAVFVRQLSKNSYRKTKSRKTLDPAVVGSPQDPGCTRFRHRREFQLRRFGPTRRRAETLLQNCVEFIVRTHFGEFAARAHKLEAPWQSRTQSEMRDHTSDLNNELILRLHPNELPSLTPLFVSRQRGLSTEPAIRGAGVVVKILAVEGPQGVTRPCAL